MIPGNQRLEQRKGEAVTLWRLEHGADQLHCFIVEPPNGYWVAVQRRGELVFSDTYGDLDSALLRAEGLKTPLIVAGWTEVDDE
jgi:hypothetical protein